MADISKDELQVEQTEGFKVSESKTIDEYQKLGELMPFHYRSRICQSSLSLSHLHTSANPTNLILPSTQTPKTNPSANGKPP